MELKSIKISNFKKIQSVNMELSDISYLVGGNNSGKSSVLQAIHMAVGCGQRASEAQEKVIAENTLRYSPTGNFLNLGNAGPYENRSGGSRAIIEFSGKTSENADASYKIEISKARNHHNIGVDRSGVYAGFGQAIVDPKTLFSVYVPGLAGIPHQEEMQSYASVFRRAAGGEANLVFRNIIRLISEKDKLGTLKDLLNEIMGNCEIIVKFNAEKDLYVDVKIGVDGAKPVPVDLMGTGALQIIQIFSYVVLFEPKILLVDEPDSHLHPSKQALLSKAFSAVVEKYNCKIVVATHSRHLVSSASTGTKIIWMRDGKVESQERPDLSAMLLEIGALDQMDSVGCDILICTEDAGKEILEQCIKALHESERIKVISYNGVNNAASSLVIKTICGMLSRSPKVIIHRDRDYLNDEEVAIWGEPYTSNEMNVFCPRLQDTESYIVTQEHLEKILSKEPQEISDLVTEVFGEVSAKVRAKFKEKRKEALQKFWKEGGSPRNEDLWPSGEPMSKETAFGKEVLKVMNKKIQEKYGKTDRLSSQHSDLLCEELKVFLATN